LARRTNSPWSKTYKEGLTTSAVNDHVNIDQNVSATITTGVIDSTTGQWKGITVTDDNFLIDATHEAVPNGASVLSPQATPDYIDMTDYRDFFMAIKPSTGGNYKLEAVMGPAHNYFANLTPVNAATVLRGAIGDVDSAAPVFPLFVDNAESLTADVWNIFYICGRLAYQKLLQFKITNNSGGESDIQFAYLRVA